MTSLKKQTFKGIKWLTAESLIDKIMQTLTTVVLARLLEPADFGLFALAFVAMRGIILFRSMGFDSAVIQRKDDILQASSTAHCIIMIMGMVSFLVLFLISPLLAKFFNNFELVPIVQILGVMFIMTALARIPSALMEKEMLFHKIAIIDILTTIVYSIFSICLALWGLGVFSLVFAYILKVLFRMVAILFVSPWRMSFKYHHSIAKELFHFGKYRFGDSVVGFFRNNTDNIIIGKFLGAALLGYYALAFNISNFLSKYLLAKVGVVLFPAFSKIQTDEKSLQRIYLKSVSYLSLLAIPFAAMIFVLAEDIIYLIYGAKWAPAIPIVRILAVASSVNMLGGSAESMILAKGNSRALFVINVLMGVLFVVIVIPMIKLFGLHGAANALLLINLVGLLRTVYLVLKHLHINVSQILKQLKLSAVSSCVMVIVIWVLRTLFPFHSGGEIVRMVVVGFEAMIGFACFVVVVWWKDRDLFNEMKGLVFSNR